MNVATKRADALHLATARRIGPDRRLDATLEVTHRWRVRVRAIAGSQHPLPFLVTAQPGIRADRDRPQLALQLDPASVALGGELARGERRIHRASWLGRVRAVVEATVRRQRLHVGERLVDAAAIPQLQLANARRVDHDAAARQLDQLAMHRRVPALVVVDARLLHGHALAADEAIHERRLADAARAEQDGGDARLEPRTQLVAALAGQPLTTCTGTPSATASTSATCARRILQAVRLGEHDLWDGAALPDRDEVALDPARLEIRAERR